MTAEWSAWKKSSRSSSQGNGDCVEVRNNGVEFQVRDSKMGEGSPILDLSSESFMALMRAAQR